MTHFTPSGLMFRVVVPVAAVLFLLIAGTISTMAWLSMQDARARLAERAKLTASMLSYGLAPLAWSLDWDAARLELASLRADPDYAGSIIWDDLGEVVVQDGRTDRGEGDIVRQTASISYAEENGRTQQVGRVEVSLQTDRAKIEMVRRLSVIAIGGLIALLAICAVLAYIVRDLIRPINALTATMTDLAAGDIDLPVPALDRGDEIGRMAVSTEVFKQNAVALRNSEARYRDLLENLQEGVFQATPEGKLLSVNQAMADILGWNSPEEMVAAITDIGKQFYADSGRRVVMLEELRENGSVRGFEVPLVRKDGKEIVTLLSARGVITDGRLTRLEGAVSDISERKKAEEKINELAFFDQLTGLPNRRLLTDRLNQALAASTRNRREGALFFVDLDHFKTVNDTQGHDKGDLLLREVARRLSANFREADTVARIGGDEFVVVLTDLSEHSEEAAAQAKTAGEKVLAVLGEPYQISGDEFRCTPSIGITLFGGQRGSLDDLMKQADIAMYQAKAAGRNTLRFFDLDLQIAIEARVAMEGALRQALKSDEFVLHYQPQMGPRGLLSAEALIRWRHPERGMVSPAEFIPLAEETGLILPLGHWVLETACRQLAAWARQPELTGLAVAVNVSVRQFRHPDFVDQVLAVLKKTAANPQRLKLELTESLLVDNVQDVIEKMFALKAKGVGFSLDDFGTGYSSLSYLKRLPLDHLKIDRSFVRDVLIDPNDAAIAKTIVALADSLGLGVIAEGVETVEQRDFLAKSGCHAYQGYLFSRPLPSEKFEQFSLERWRC
jgi:diguanylate cyclase (GGDEF)-like protein/PAS domain S-box-containing protein